MVLLGETIDGTNNGCERGIGWWIKERYRPMCSDKREQSAVNVSRLLAWVWQPVGGGRVSAGGARLAETPCGRTLPNSTACFDLPPNIRCSWY